MHVIWGNLAIHALKNSRRVFDNQENFRLRGQAGGPGPYRYARLLAIDGVDVYGLENSALTAPSSRPL